MPDLFDLGQKHATGMGHSKKEHSGQKEPDGFFGHFDMGDQKPQGMGDDAGK